MRLTILLTTVFLFFLTLGGKDLSSLKAHVPPFARAVGFFDGEKLLAVPGNVKIFEALLPGIGQGKLKVEELFHDYLFFAAEDLKLYGAVIKCGKGSLKNLRALMEKAPGILYRSLGEDMIFFIRGVESSLPLHLPKDETLLNMPDSGKAISAAGRIRLEKLTGKTPRKLLAEFPELKHLESLRYTFPETGGVTRVDFIFDNAQSPRKGFRFLNWGISLVLVHKLGEFRYVGQQTFVKRLSLTVADLPYEKAVMKIYVPGPRNSRISRPARLQLMAAAMLLFSPAEKFLKEPGTLRRFFPNPEFFPKEKEFIYLLPGAERGKPGVPDNRILFMEDPKKISSKRNFCYAAFADGRVEKIQITSPRKLTPEELLEEINRQIKSSLPKGKER